MPSRHFATKVYPLSSAPLWIVDVFVDECLSARHGPIPDHAQAKALADALSHVLREVPGGTLRRNIVRH